MAIISFTIQKPQFLVQHEDGTIVGIDITDPGPNAPARQRLDYAALLALGKHKESRDRRGQVKRTQPLDYMALAAYRDSHASTRRCEIPGHMIDAYLEEWTSMERRESKFRNR